MTKTKQLPPTLRQIQIFMSQIPNFPTKRTGTHIYKEKGSANHSGCSYCADYLKRRGCKHRSCQYLGERIKGGGIGYGELLKSTYFDITDNLQFKKRLSHLSRTFSGSMFLTKEHHYRFFCALNEMRKISTKQSNSYLAALYLLTATEQLWDIVKKHVGSLDVFFAEIKLKSMDTDSYIFYQTAKELLTETSKIKLSEILDEAITSDDAFGGYINSALIKIYGIKILNTDRR